MAIFITLFTDGETETREVKKLINRRAKTWVWVFQLQTQGSSHPAKQPPPSLSAESVISKGGRLFPDVHLLLWLRVTRLTAVLSHTFIRFSQSLFCVMLMGNSSIKLHVLLYRRTSQNVKYVNAYCNSKRSISPVCCSQTYLDQITQKKKTIKALYTKDQCLARLVHFMRTVTCTIG